MATRKQFFGLVLIGASAVFGLCAAEVIFRLCGIGPKLVDSVYYEKDPHLPFKFSPNSPMDASSVTGEFNFNYKTNGIGLVDVEHALEKPPNTFRILGLGDSFTVGIGAPFAQSYLYRLESALNARSGVHPHVEIIKAGQNRYWPEPEYVMGKEYGLKFGPDLLLVGFLPNDVADTFYGWNAVTVSPSRHLISREAVRFGEAGEWLSIHSRLARVILGSFNRYSRDRAMPFYWADVYKDEGRHETQWKEIENSFQKLGRLARSRGVKMGIIYIPQQGPWLPEQDYPAQRLTRFCKKAGCFVIDTLPSIIGASANRNLYWKKDGHCNSDGYQVIGETVYNYLVAEHFVP